MAYEPKNWECGDVVTADDLNHLERGVAEASSGGGTALVVKAVSTRPATEEECSETSGTVTTYDHTWQEVKDAYDAGLPVYLQVNDVMGDMRLHLSAVDDSIGYMARFTADSVTKANLYANTQDGTLVSVLCSDR